MEIEKIMVTLTMQELYALKDLLGNITDKQVEEICRFSHSPKNIDSIHNALYRIPCE